MATSILALVLCAIGACTSATPFVHPYDEETARKFAFLSAITYCDDTTYVSDWTCASCKEAGVALKNGSIHVVDGGLGNAVRILIGKLRDEHGCVVAFRGTDSPWNWYRNIQYWFVKPVSFEGCNGCEVERGFYSAWVAVRNKVFEALSLAGCDPAIEPDNLLYITGHSFGAALTHLAMFDLASRGFVIAKTYSFGAPRVGNDVFTKEFSSRFDREIPVFRITHAQDPVVHVPPASWGYRHVQVEVYYNRDGNYALCEHFEDPSCSGKFRNWLDSVLFHSGDHCATPLIANGDLCNPDCGRRPLMVI
eukprot:TRINITY_DN76124_c0_g1_i1.p1 TRINITY_DN76124_c0_g1~~TRINITY_DN76124_c0_g1_i1.p1  ORF type:complete len:336 (-),score=27.39 TRINITY_DN76124_c0_g1_i1:166-1086(-)